MNNEVRRAALREYLRLVRKDSSDTGRPIQIIVVEDFSRERIEVPRIQVETEDSEIYSVHTDYGDLTFNARKHVVQSPLVDSSHTIKLRSAESDILEVLFQRANQVVSVAKLYNSIKFHNRARFVDNGSIDYGSISVHMSHLRKKLGDRKTVLEDGTVDYMLIRTASKEGYFFAGETI